MIEFLLSGGPEGTNDLLYLIISNDGHYYYYPGPPSLKSSHVVWEWKWSVMETHTNYITCGV